MSTGTDRQTNKQTGRYIKKEENVKFNYMSDYGKLYMNIIFNFSQLYSTKFISF